MHAGAAVTADGREERPPPIGPLPAERRQLRGLRLERVHSPSKTRVRRSLPVMADVLAAHRTLVAALGPDDVLSDPST